MAVWGGQVPLLFFLQPTHTLSLFPSLAWIITVCHMKQLQLASSIKSFFFFLLFIQHLWVPQRSLITHNDTLDLHVIAASLGLGQQQEKKKKKSN